MQHLRSLLLAALGLLSILPAGRAQEITLETRADTTTALYCEMLHSTSCSMVHVETTTQLTAGASLQLDGKAYVITWTGPGYYLANGVILEVRGEVIADLKGQRWAETKPHEGRLHVSRAWKDTDGNGALSVSDTLALDDGPEVEVKDVRLHVRVRLAPEKKK